MELKSLEANFLRILKNFIKSTLYIFGAIYFILIENFNNTNNCENQILKTKVKN